MAAAVKSTSHCDVGCQSNFGHYKKINLKELILTDAMAQAMVFALMVNAVVYSAIVEHPPIIVALDVKSGYGHLFFR